MYTVMYRSKPTSEQTGNNENILPSSKVPEFKQGT
jgi:hypothetical protein